MRTRRHVSAPSARIEWQPRSLAGSLHHRLGMIDAGDEAFRGLFACHLCGNARAEPDLQNAIVLLDVEQGYSPLGVVDISFCHAIPDDFPEESAWAAKLLGDEFSDPLLHDAEHLL
jgi:hypothetical protein